MYNKCKNIFQDSSAVNVAVGGKIYEFWLKTYLNCTQT